MEKIQIQSLPYAELENQVTDMGMPRYRAGQIYKWLHTRFATDFSEMTDLSMENRRVLNQYFRIENLLIKEVQVSKEDGTRKYLFLLSDGNMIESVWMPYHHGNSVCVSSQAGCRMGCRFCASTVDGLSRSLTPAEMLGQVYAISRETGERVSNVVVMGSGEPLDNYENVCTFIRLLSDPRGPGISQRNITVSTCGIVPKIYDLAKENLVITLAISLHAPNDALRRTMMPVADAYPLADLMQACRYYYEQTKRRLTFEYSLVRDVNDGPAQARELAALLRGLNCHVNLIPVNPIKEREFRQSERQNVQKFKKLLEKYGINATIRREMGRDIDGACGQLRRRYLEKTEQ